MCSIPDEVRDIGQVEAAADAGILGGRHEVHVQVRQLRIGSPERPDREPNDNEADDQGEAQPVQVQTALFMSTSMPAALSSFASRSFHAPPRS